MKKNLFSKVLAVVLTLAMVLGLSTTALAEGVSTGTSATPVTSVGITKTVTTDGNTYKPATTFGYTVTTAESGTYTDVNGTTYTVSSGIEGGLTTTSTTSAPNADDQLSDRYTITGGSLDVVADKFTSAAPGVYHYTLKESKGNYDGIVYDSTTYEIYVFVYRDDTTGNCYVGNIVSTKDVNGTATKADLEFTNNYGNDSGSEPADPTNPTPDEKNDSTHDVTITKAISGTFANANDEFTFTVGVTGADGEIYKVVYYTDSNDDGGSTIKVASGSTITVSGIKATGKIVIYGLTESDTYSVEETNYSTLEYTPSVTYGDGTTKDGSNSDNSKAVGTVSSDSAKVTVTNTKNATTPTGLIFTYGPYALMVLIALAGCVVFFRRRRTTMD